MGNWTHSDFPASFFQVQRKIEQWRRRHRPRARIPEELWREVAELAGTHGVNRTARALRLDYYSLQKRVAAAARSRQRIPEFVEILPGGMPAPQPPGPPRPECTIEVEDPGGAKLRIHLQGGDVPDVAALTRAFRECRT
jgi:hypothetical protein